MKNKVKDYVGLSEEDKKYLREFDNAIERGYFKDDLVKIPEDMKSQIEEERNKFKNDLMFKGRRKSGDVSDMVFSQKVSVGKKKVKYLRDENGKFKKVKDEDSGNN